MDHQHGDDQRMDDDSGPFEASIAVYRPTETGPTVERLLGDDPRALLHALTDRVQRLLVELGGAIPHDALAAVIENLAHAEFQGAVVSILDEGNSVRVADAGPGIAEKHKALLPGFSGANPAARRLVKGVGSGLAVAQAALAELGGRLELDDNLAGGTVVTLWVPPGSVSPSPEAAPSTSPAVSTTERELKVLLLLLELGPTGPTRLAGELRVSSSTAYRDMVHLQKIGLLEADEEGHRTLTAEGLRHLEAVL